MTTNPWAQTIKKNTTTRRQQAMSSTIDLRVSDVDHTKANLASITLPHDLTWHSFCGNIGILIILETNQAKQNHSWSQELPSILVLQTTECTNHNSDKIWSTFQFVMDASLPFHKLFYWSLSHLSFLYATLPHTSNLLLPSFHQIISHTQPKQVGLNHIPSTTTTTTTTTLRALSSTQSLL